MPRPGCPWPGLCVFKRLIHKGFHRLTLDGAQQIPSARGNKSAGGIGASLTLTPRLAADSVRSYVLARSHPLTSSEPAASL